MLIVHIINDGTGERWGSYEYTVEVNGECIGAGHVTGHDRSKGWASLLRLIADDGSRSAYPPPT